MRRRLLPALLLAAATPFALAQPTPPRTAPPKTAPAQAAPPQTIDAGTAVATVNGEAIPASEYYRRLEWFRPDPKSALASYPAGFQVLRQMISERMILQLAKSENVAPTAPEIDARLAQTYRDNPTLKAEIAEAGGTEADLRTQLIADEARFKLVTAGVTITDQQVEKRYVDTPDEFRQPARYKLRIIAVGDSDTQAKVDAALRANRPFADVVRDFSLDSVTKNTGGEYGEVSENSLADAVRRAIEVTPVGSTTAWIQGAGSQARVKFLVEAVVPAKMLPLDATLRTSIRRQMMLEIGKNKNGSAIAKDLDAATLSAKVTLVQTQFQKFYNDILDRLKKAQG